MFFARRIIIQTSCACRNVSKFGKRQDPGISRQKQILQLEENEEMTEFEDLESDFMGVHKSHKEYEREMELMKERQKYLIVKQKYFKEKFPNFLTWYDKEQIRYLHRTDPEEWTIERLSEGFPALPDVIRKIVQGSWTKTKPTKIINHDAAVQKNWNLFKEGQMKDLPQDLVKHLHKFTNRTLNLKPFVLPSVPKTIIHAKNTNSTEFSDIIESYQKLKKNPQSENAQINTSEVNQPPQNETYITTSLTKRKSVTLNQLQLDLKKKAELGKNIDEDEKYIIKKSLEKEKRTEQEVQNHFIDLSVSKYKKSKSLQFFKKSEKDLSHLMYPEKISIPKAIFKKGFIYKLNDCYYDDDGEFLYRVPGMG